LALKRETSARAFLAKIQNDLKKIVQPIAWRYDDLEDLEILIILLEDRRFFQHRGIDFRSVLRELFMMCTFQKFGGASTIDMQYVRMRTGYYERTLPRKLYEMLLAYLLQKRMDKASILRAYMQEMYLGSHIYGVESCARVLFNKARYELERAEAAQIAAMMVYPRPLHPDAAWQRRVARRADYGLRLFEKYGREYTRRSE
jgi:membrane peptidoglycan carboxypeptidase